jgi:hypothetical protein
LRDPGGATIVPRGTQENLEEGHLTELDLARRLEELFREVGEAHHQAYIETDGADPEWPLWYADYLRERLGPLLDANFTKSELVYLLILLSNEQPLRAPGANWARYYAGFFIERYAAP